MVLLVATLGACNSGSGGGSGDQGVGTTAGGAATTVAGATVGTGGTASGEYCTLGRSYARAFERFGQPGTPAEQRAYYQQASADIKKAIEVAPSEIRADVETVAGVLQSLVTALEAINYDFTRVVSLPPELITKLMSQPFTGAASRVAAYGRDRCGSS